MAREEVKVDSPLIRLCIEAACKSSESVERWRMQRRTLQLLPSPIAEALLHRLLHRRLLYPSLLEIFKSSLEDLDLSGDSSISAEWIAYVGGFSQLRSLNLAECSRLTSTALWPIAGLTSLREINLSKCVKFGNDGIHHLLSIPHLERLHISQTKVTDDGIKHLSSLENLTDLDLGGLRVSDSAIDYLQGLTRLEYLDLWGSNISNEGIQILRKFPKLKHLSLAWTRVSVFPNLKHLEYLDMSTCTIDSVLEENGDISPLRKLIFHAVSFEIPAEAFSCLDKSFLTFLDVSHTTLDHFGFLQHMYALEHLDLSSSIVLDESLEQIAKVGANLRHLNLNGTTINSAGLATLVGHVTKLESLSLSHTMIDDAALVYISMMTQLQSIDLSATKIKGLLHQIDDEDEVLSLAELKNLHHLKKLNLSGTPIADSELSPLSSLQSLTKLSLRSANLTDSCLLHLASITSLVNLSINDALLSDTGLNSFDPSPNLIVLDLSGCWLLTADAFSKYCQKHPRIRVRHELLHITSASNKSGTKQKGPKSSGTPSPFNRDLWDQRIKYSMEQLLSLQQSSSALAMSAHIGSLIPEELIES